VLLHALHELAQQVLGDLEVRDDAVLERANGVDLVGVRPSISLASLPTASTRFVLFSTATTDGSLSTMPRPFTQTSVFAVPRSMATSVEKNPITLSRNILAS
jgi:hypothetical protein